MKRIAWGLALLFSVIAAGCCSPFIAARCCSPFIAAGCCSPALATGCCSPVPATGCCCPDRTLERVEGQHPLAHQSLAQIGDGPFAVWQTTQALEVLPSTVPETVPPTWFRVGAVYVHIDQTGQTFAADEDFWLIEDKYRPPSPEDPNVSIGFVSLSSSPATTASVQQREFLIHCVWPLSSAPLVVLTAAPTSTPPVRMIYDGWYALWQGHVNSPVGYVQAADEYLTYYLSSDYRWPSKTAYPNIVIHYEYLKPLASTADLQALSGWQTILCWGNK